MTDVARPRFADVVTAAAARWPDAHAVEDPQTTLTFAQLVTAANDVAAALRGGGIGAGDLVAVWGSRSATTFAGLLGVTMAGAAFLPLEPRHPFERLRHAFDDAGACAAIAATDLPRVQQLGGATLWLPDLSLTGTRRTVAREPLPEDAAYVIYTSGSTGRPKGALLLHSGWCNLVEAERQLLGLGSDDRVMQFASLSFDASVWEIAMAWGVGATLCVPPTAVPLAGLELTDWIDREAVTAATLAPSVLAAMDPDDVPTLRLVISAGEACPPRVVERWSRGRRFVNAYGPTEATVAASAREYCDEAPERVTIGTPLPGVTLHVLDEDRAPVADGVEGELWVGGAGVAAGYIGREQLTAERFVEIDDGFETRRLYRTGDRVRRRPDGEFEFLGRVDDQVKILGHRIELGEIELVLQESEAVREAIVTVSDDAGHPRLVGYVTLLAQVSPSELQAWLAERLPDQMIPSTIMVLDAFPLTSSAKVDRAALPRPGQEQDSAAEDRPTTPGEAGAVGEIVAEFLGASIASDRDIFEAGCSSLQAAELVGRLRQQFDARVTLRDVYRERTASAIARRIVTGSAAGFPALVPRGAGAAVPLSIQQRHMLRFMRAQPSDAFYEIAHAWSFDGELDLARVGAAWDATARRHEALRTRIVNEQQAISATPEPPRVTEVVAGGDDRLASALSDSLLAPYRLADEPLARLHVAIDPAGRTALGIGMHHLVSDGIAFARVLRDFWEAFTDAGAHRASATAVQYGDYAVWQQRMLDDGGFEQEVAYWQPRLAGAVPPRLSTGTPDGAAAPYDAGVVALAVPATVTGRLRALARELGVTEFCVLFSAFAAFAGTVAGQDDVTIATHVPNRMVPGTRDVVGFFANAVLVRLPVRAGDPFGRHARRTQEALLDAYDHQTMPVQELLDRVDAHDAYEVLFALEEFGAIDAPAGTPLPLSSVAKSRRDLCVYLSPDGDGLRGSIGFALDRHDRRGVERLANAFVQALDALSCGQADRVGQLGPAERVER
jgi:amino acid adenylation domain-containing protein